MANKYHVLLIWQSDLVKESREVRKFFKDFNKKTAKKKYGVTFELIDYCIDGAQGGRPGGPTPEELLESNRATLALTLILTPEQTTTLADLPLADSPVGALAGEAASGNEFHRTVAIAPGAKEYKESLAAAIPPVLEESTHPWINRVVVTKSIAVESVQHVVADKTISVDNRLEASRRDKLQAIAKLGHDPWGQRFDDAQPIADIRACETQIEETDQGPRGPKVRAAGRIMLQRTAGKLLFVDIKDRTGNIQLLIGKKQVGDDDWALAELFDLGDIIGVDGQLGKTKTGELTIFAEKLHFLTKSLEPPPEKHHGINDPELRQRMRYLDLIHTEGVLDTFLARTKVVQSIRHTLNDDGYIEIEGPTLHSIAGGAAARPFITHHNTLDMELYLRIALELHLKRLLVGGMERVYELGRVYRNEGISPKHNPEFTMLEVYQAYGNYETMMDLTEALVVNAIDAIGGSRKLPWGEAEIDFTPPFARKTYAELFEQHTGVAADDEAGIKKLAEQIGFDTDGKHPDVIKNEVFEEKVEDQLAGPIFVMDYPASICPLTKRKADAPHIAERFEMFIQGMEIANAYTELNDPDLQEELFKTQLAGMSEEDSMAKMDHDFIRALRHGMPPAGGLGVGIDRLVMLLTNSQTIREVILFPLLRHEAQ